MDQRTEPITGIPAAELQERRERLLEQVRRLGLTGYVLFGADAIQYFTGFWFLSNERPVIYAESTGGDSAIFVPDFEVERTRAEAEFARVASYPEYPGVEVLRRDLEPSGAPLTEQLADLVQIVTRRREFVPAPVSVRLGFRHHDAEAFELPESL